MKKRIYPAIFLVTCFFTLSGCSASDSQLQTKVSTEAQTDTAETDVDKMQSGQTESVQTTVLKSEVSDSSAGETILKGATLYIGSNGSFQEYHLDCEDNASPDELIQGIADLTGWDLSLADPVSTGKGGMTVCFSSQSALFTGPPQVQKEEFHMFDATQLVSTILDSIQATLQNYYIDPTLGDPSNLDIYFCMEGNQPITLDNLGITIPMDQPYSGLTSAETELPQTETSSKGATLYIGSNGSFQEYHLDCEDNASPDELIQGIADLTGWDLSLADPVSTGKGGMTVCFSSQSALFTGPPQVQKEEFHMFDATQLVSTILDSIQATLQNYYIDPTLGDPSNLDIYFCMEGNHPITLDNLGITIPMDQPYSGLFF